MGRRYKRGLTRKQQRELNRFILGIVIISISIYLLVWLYNLAKPFFLFIAIAIAIIVVYVAYKHITKMIKRRKLKGTLGDDLQRALEAMDSTSKTYTDEKEANRELVIALKSQGHNAIYEFLLPNRRRTADAKVDDVLIEGKLAPTVDEVDRLFGQLQEYCQSPYKVYVVIYGRIGKTSRKRIENEILERYPQKAFLTYLDNPKRCRKQ